MSKIKKITVSNLKAVSALTADFKGMTCIITGGNNKGKSTFLRSLPDRLRGVKPDIILKHNEKEGFAELELTTGERFLWQFDGKKEKLTFFTEKNIPTGVTKGICAAYFPPVFDVDEFLNSAPAKQKQVLQKLTGIDFTEIDKLYKEAYEIRAYANKRLAEEKTLVEKSTWPYDEKLPFIENPTAELEKELQQVEAHNFEATRVATVLDDKKKKVVGIDDEVFQLEQRIKTLIESKTTIQDEIKKGEEWLAKPANKPKDEITRAAIVNKIKIIKEENISIVENNKARALRESFEKARVNAEEAAKDVEKIEAEKADVIKNASMPDGFGFNDDGITYNSLPFTREQLSSSGIYIGALKLAAIGLGEVKTLHFDASFLDKNSLADIEKWANDNSLQLLIERPDFEGGEIEYQIVQDAK